MQVAQLGLFIEGYLAHKKQRPYQGAPETEPPKVRAVYERDQVDVQISAALSPENGGVGTSVSCLHERVVCERN